ncbi:putative nuclease HARBI1 [Tribolium castaneum]|uniref:putative nuclease HARBI1 n=1 Tax=Tribolium castaneum TaxID=7070 RepID=UPI0030FE3B69
MAVSQSSTSRAIDEVTNALNHQAVFNQWVHFPRNLVELRSLRTQFFKNQGFAGVIGCLDCTYVALWPPNILNANMPEHIFICDSELRILNVNAKFPGSTHDAHIWRTSNVQPLLTNLHQNGHKSFFLLGNLIYIA